MRAEEVYGITQSTRTTPRNKIMSETRWDGGNSWRAVGSVSARAHVHDRVSVFIHALHRTSMALTALDSSNSSALGGGST